MKSIFISFSEKDRDKVSILEYRLKKSEFVDYLIVADKYNAAENISAKVIKGIESCQYFVPILTRKSMLSQWINQEIGYAIKTKFKIKIIPIVEAEILDQLHGFVHKDYYPIFTYKNSRTGNLNFKECIEKLIHLIEVENGKSNNLSDIFTGLWRNDYILNDYRDVEIFNIKQGVFYANGIPIFNLSEAKFNDSGTGFSFISQRIGSKAETKTTLVIENKIKLTGISNNGATIRFSKLTTPLLNSFYLQNVNKIKLPKFQKLELILKYHEGNLESKFGIVVGEINLRLQKNRNVTYYKFVEMSKYDLYLRTDDTKHIFLLPTFIIYKFKKIK